MQTEVIIVSLHQEFKKTKCSNQNESVVESTNDIVISVFSNSDKDVTINDGDVLCHLIYINI
jgi:hypothetical protein